MSYRTIRIKRYVDIVNEYDAGEAILPGSVLQLQSDKTVNNNTSSGPLSVMVAMEDELLGNTTRDEYQSGDVVQCWNVVPGEEFLALLPSGSNPSVGDYLEPSTANAGALKSHASGTAIAQVVEPRVQDDEGNYRVHVRAI